MHYTLSEAKSRIYLVFTFTTMASSLNRLSVNVSKPRMINSYTTCSYCTKTCMYIHISCIRLNKTTNHFNLCQVIIRFNNVGQSLITKLGIVFFSFITLLDTRFQIYVVVSFVKIRVRVIWTLLPCD